MWKYVKPLEDKTLVIKFLKKQGVEIPEKLLHVLIENNGGRPEKKLFETEKRGEYIFQSLLSYNEGDMISIYNIYDDRFKNKGIYPIGISPAGDYICYNTKSEDFELYKHETSNVEKIKKLYFL